MELADPNLDSREKIIKKYPYFIMLQEPKKGKSKKKKKKLPVSQSLIC
jgi:hypothetical protein